MRVESTALVLALAIAPAFALGPACGGSNDIHDVSSAALNKDCYSCHSTAYETVQTPIHLDLFPTTCADCHSTTAWLPAQNNHPEAAFPITTGSHANAGIRCTDCHNSSLGLDTGGLNTDCVDCHLGAHNGAANDTIHAGISGYPGFSAGVATSPHFCLSCHPSG